LALFALLETIAVAVHLEDVDVVGEPVERWCQSNANQSPNSPAPPSSCRQLTPLGPGGRAALLEDIAAIEMAI
jgi:hypothetical protein